MDIELQQDWLRSKTQTHSPQRLPSRVAMPLIGAICASLWAGIFLGWHLVF